MAISAIAGLATAVGAALAPGALTLFGLGAAGSFAAAFAVGAGLSAVSRALMPRPSFDQMRGLNFNVRDPQSPKKMIYGRSRIGGTIIAIGSSGTDNKYLTMVIAIAGHRLQEFEEIYFNDEKIWDSGYQGDWGNYVEHEFIVGYDTDQSSTLADNGIANWVSSGYYKRHTLNGVAALVVRLEYDAEVFTSGVPNISVVVKGTRAYDPRQDSTSSYYDSSVGDSYHRPTGSWSEEGYTTNPAIILLDYLTNEKYGLGESIDNIDLQSVADAADICNEDVALDAGGTQKRFTCDGVLDTANTHKANIENILSSMIGTLTLVGGKYVMTAHAYQSPSLDINEDNLIAPLEVSTKQSRRNIYNAVKGSFVSEEENYVVADYPSQVSSSYAAADGETIYLDMALPMTTNNIRAQRIARLTMLKSRLQTTVKMRLNLTGLKVKVGDNIRLSNTRLGYSNKIFEIINYNLVLDQEAGLAVEIEAIENDSAAYTWNTSDELDFTVGGTVTLYDGKTAQPATNLVLTPDATVNDDGTVVGTIEASWTVPDDAFTDRYEITWQNATDSGQIYKQTTLGTPFVITGVLPNKQYQVIVYAINELGVKSTGLSGAANTPADFAPKVPSIYRITKANANAPTTAEFSTAAGRDPKDKDAVITKDTSTTPHSTHAWTYDDFTSSWDQDDDFITGDLIVNGSITGDQITANSIQVNKLTGDVSETFPINFISGMQTLPGSGTAETDNGISIPAPQLGLAKRLAVELNIHLSAENGSSGQRTATVDILLQKASKGQALGVQVNTSPIANIYTNYPQTGVTTVRFAGGDISKLATIGAVASAASTDNGRKSTILGYYQALSGTPWGATSYTYIMFDSSNSSTTAQFSVGSNIFFNPDSWESAGTFIDGACSETIIMEIPAGKKVSHVYSISEDLGLMTTQTDFRIKATHTENITALSTPVTIHRQSGNAYLIA